MTRERVKCPFCSELILQDAIKCRFCGEWLTKPGQELNAGGPIRDSDLEGLGWENYPLVVKRSQSESPSYESNQQSDYEPLGAADDQVEERVENGEPEQENRPARIAKEVVPAEKAELASAGKRSGVPWLRALLLFLYLGIVAALIVAEFDARSILRDARAEEAAKDPNAAFAGYRTVQDIYPFTLASIEARQNLRRLSESPEFGLPQPAWLAAGEKLLGVEIKEQNVHLLPLAAWPVSAFLLLLVVLTRIRRVGVALIALILMILAVSGSVAQFAWYGVIPLGSVAQAVEQFMEMPEALHIASYILLFLTALMTLTATVPRIHLHIAKMAEATARKQ